MVSISERRSAELFLKFKNCKVAVVGDLMLDRYLWGTVARISPEAPVPVVEIESEATRLGGAANVVNNIAGLGAVAFPVGVIGDDFAGATLLQLFRERNFDTTAIVKDKSRTTSVKTRIIAHGQHVVRADRESKTTISSEIADKLITQINKFIDTCDAIIFQDYNKGLLTPELIYRIINIASSKGKIITVDPKFDNFFEYRGVTVFKPNRRETEQVLGKKLTTESELHEACHLLKEKLSCQNVLITLSEKGMCLLENSNNFTLVPTKAKEVHDVSGAGDTVISTLTIALAAGASLKEAVTLANYAAGIVCSEVGVVPIDIKQLTGVFK